MLAVAIAKNVDASSVDGYAQYLARLLPDIAALAAHDIFADKNKKELQGNAELQALIDAADAGRKTA